MKRIDEIEIGDDKVDTNRDVEDRFKRICIIVACVAAFALYIALRILGYGYDRGFHGFYRMGVIAMTSFF